MDAVFRLRGDGVSMREVDGVTVILDLTESTYMTVNASGTVLLEPLRRGAPRNELTAVLLSKFNTDKERADADVRSFLQALDEQGLLVTDGGD